MTSLLVALALSGCHRASPPGDARTYLEVVTAGEALPLEEAFARCGRIVDPHTRGDCQLWVAQRPWSTYGRPALADARRPSEAPPTPPEAFCDRVEASPWRQECWFWAAEVRASSGELERAESLCERAVAYLEPCTRGIVAATAHRLLAAGAEADPAALFAAVNDRLGDWPERAGVTNALVLSAVLDVVVDRLGPPIDPERCGEVAELAGACHAYLRARLTERLDHLLADRVLHEAFCRAADLPGRLRALAPRLVLLPGPTTTHLVETATHRHCVPADAHPG